MVFTLIATCRFIDGNEEPFRGDDDDNDDTAVPLHVSWFDRCVHKCRLCDYRAYTRTTMERHQKKCPLLSETPGVEKAEAEVIRRRLHKCLECGWKVAHCWDDITSHLGRRHGGMSVNAYANKHGLGIEKREAAAGDSNDRPKPKRMRDTRTRRSVGGRINDHAMQFGTKLRRRLLYQ